MLKSVYKTLRLNHNLAGWLSRHLTLRGQVVLAGALCTGILGIDTNQTTCYQIFTLLSAALIISGIASRCQRLRLRASRRAPRFGTVGVPLKYKISVENPTNRPQQSWQISENLHQPYPAWQEFRQLASQVYEIAKGPIHARQIFYPRWFQYVRQQYPASSQPVELPRLLPQRPSEVTLELLPLKRGVLHLKGLTLACPDPLGLANASRALPLPQSVLVLPKRYPIPQIQLPGARRHQSGGMALSSAVGDSQEFRSLRDYRPEDSPRKLHWKSWAKVGKPMVKEEQDEYFVRHALILDTFTGEGTNSLDRNEIFEAAISVAASFACEVKTQESLLDLLFVGLETHCFTTGRGLEATEQMLAILAAVQPCQDAEFKTLIPLILKRVNLLSGCICVFLSWDLARQELLQRLEQLRIPTLALVIQDDALPTEEIAQLETPPNVHFLKLGQIEAGLMQLC